VAENEWNTRFAAYRAAFPAEAAEFQRRVIDGQLPGNWAETKSTYIKSCRDKSENIATRKASQNAIATLVPAVPEIFGGSADLAGSNLTFVKGSKGVSRTEGGNYCYYGVRDWSKSLTEPDNYLRRVLAIDGSAEDTAEYDEVRDARQLFCYFTGSTSEAELDATAQRILARFRDAPRRIRFETVSEYAASIKPGQLVSLMARELVDDDGEPYSVACWVVSKARKSDIVWSFECIQDSDQTSARWWYWNSETAPAYDSATDEEKLCAFWADDATEKVGDDAPYCWI
jgi:hypothetical protein